MAVHYRIWDDHTEGCHAFSSEEPVRSGVPTTGGATRSGRRKKDDSFQVFDPGHATRPPVLRAGNADGEEQPGGSVRPTASPGSRHPKDPREEVAGLGVSSTGFVEDLAQLWEEAKTDAEIDALLDEQISVVGVGNDKLRFLFKRVSKSAVGARDRIWYGGAVLKRYGKGFSLRYYDRAADGKRLSTYISADEIASYRYRGLLLDTLDRARDRKYVTAYVWGEIEADESDPEKASLKPKNLKHLCLVLGPLQEAVESVGDSNSDSSDARSQ